MNGAKFKKALFCQAWKEHKIIINKLCIRKLLLLLALGLTSDHNNFYLFLISEKKTSNFPKSSYFSELCCCMYFFKKINHNWIEYYFFSTDNFKKKSFKKPLMYQHDINLNCRKNWLLIGVIFQKKFSGFHFNLTIIEN